MEISWELNASELLRFACAVAARHNAMYKIAIAAGQLKRIRSVYPYHLFTIVSPECRPLIFSSIKNICEISAHRKRNW